MRFKVVEPTTRRFKVVERRCYDATYIFDAEGENEARRLDGEILEEEHSDCWGDDTLSVEEVDEDATL